MTDEILREYGYNHELIRAKYSSFDYNQLIETLYGKSLEGHHLARARKAIVTAFTQNPLVNRTPLKEWSI